ncbi:MAG: Uma2 family endonuclease [Deltaproteobacteria bacterium]|nr:Uma2 family endonuclease [Deltaproteobacteria bacterium]
MSLAAKIEKRFSYNDYLTWLDGERWELIDGVAYNMTPAPSFKHQRIAGNFYRILGNKLSGKSCIPGISPIDVVLSEFDVVQPDVLVVCDKNKITTANIQGAPDLVVEILSPSTAIKDKREKKALYERYGVREYILIDPTENYVERFVLRDGLYGVPDIFGPQEILPLNSLEGIEIPLWEVFEVEAPNAGIKENNNP